jgi:integration host factor subunit alpha
VANKRKTPEPERRPGLTKADLTKLVYEMHGGLTKHEAAEVVQTILHSVKDTLLEGRTVKIQNFGVFEVTDRQGRAGVDPISGERIYIPPRKGLSFRPSSKVKRLVSEQQLKDN